MKKEEEKKPDFIQIPYQLIEDKTLAHIDRLVYGAIYFYSRMRGEKCFAKNEVIAALLNSTPNAISRSLQKLDDRRYIIRVFSDPETKLRRTEIIPMVAMTKLSSNKKTATLNRVANEGSTKDVQPTKIDNKPTKTDELAYQNRVAKKDLDKKIILGKNEEKDHTAQQKNDSAYQNSSSSKLVTDREYRENNKENINGELQIRPADSSAFALQNGENFKDHLEAIKLYKKMEDIPAKLVNDSISFFIIIFPSAFTNPDKKPFEIPATRTAVKNILMTTTFEELSEIIKKYSASATDKFRPEANNIYDFCTYKFEKIKAYCQKSAGGLWAQRSISTPKQRADSDEQIKRILEKSREKRRLAKEEWEKTHNKNQDGK